MDVQELKFRENGLIPVIAQDHETGEVLMMAYMNREALQKTLETGRAWYWSRSRQALWMKGESSGHVQIVKEVRADCDGDTLLLSVQQLGPGACHEGYRSCFHNVVHDFQQDGEGRGPGVKDQRTFDPAEVYGAKQEAILHEVYKVIMHRKDHPVEGSYTSYLFRSGIDKILKKVGEEASEVVIAAKNESTRPLLEEVADLLYHLLVLLAEKGVSPRQVFDVLRERRIAGQEHAVADPKDGER